MADTQKSLGKLVGPEGLPDAVHVAVAPMIANEHMLPGAHVGLVEGHTDVATIYAKKLIGVVDPYLKQHVEPGDRFWMFLYPNTITGLRHQWTHPAFGKGEQPGVDSDAMYSPPEMLLDAENWLKQFAGTYGIQYDSLLHGLQYDDYITAGGVDLHGKEELGEDWQKLWDNAEIVLGKKFSDEHKENLTFSCSC